MGLFKPNIEKMKANKDIEGLLEAENYAMSTVMEYRDLVKFQELIK